MRGGEPLGVDLTTDVKQEGEKPCMVVVFLFFTCSCDKLQVTYADEAKLSYSKMRKSMECCRPLILIGWKELTLDSYVSLLTRPDYVIFCRPQTFNIQFINFYRY